MSKTLYPKDEKQPQAGIEEQNLKQTNTLLVKKKEREKKVSGEEGGRGSWKTRKKEQEPQRIEVKGKEETLAHLYKSQSLDQEGRRSWEKTWLLLITRKKESASRRKTERSGKESRLRGSTGGQGYMWEKGPQLKKKGPTRRVQESMVKGNLQTGCVESRQGGPGMPA